jgi:hypothetical protein
MAFALASSVQLVFLIDWDSDSSDEEDLVDYWTLPHLTRRSFGHDRARYCISISMSYGDERLKDRVV